MAKKSSIEKNNRRRKMAKQFAGRRERLKAIIVRQDQADGGALRCFAEAGRDCRATRRPTRIRNRCEVTGRPRAFYRKHKLSAVSRCASSAPRASIPGLVKSSW